MQWERVDWLLPSRTWRTGRQWRYVVCYSTVVNKIVLIHVRVKMCLSLSTRSTKKCSHPCQIGWVISNRKSYIHFLRYDNKYFVMKIYHGCWCQIKLLQHFMVMWWHIAWILNENRKKQKKDTKLARIVTQKYQDFLLNLQ